MSLRDSVAARRNNSPWPEAAVFEASQPQHLVMPI
jgi:hypothetical protein